MPIGNRPVSGLIANGTETVTTMLQIPVGLAEGTYYIVARADGNGAVAETISAVCGNG